MRVRRITILRQRAIRQRQLFENAPAVPAVQLSQQVREQLKKTLAQWLQALANALDEERGDEQNHR
jgi:hypothetical protein